MIPKVKTVQTMARAYQQICAGEEPWIALGNFRNAWYGYAKDNRFALVKDPIPEPEIDTTHTRRWGAFCAASVEFLCQRYKAIADGSHVLIYDHADEVNALIQEFLEG